VKKRKKKEKDKREKEKQVRRRNRTHNRQTDKQTRKRDIQDVDATNNFSEVAFVSVHGDLVRVSPEAVHLLPLRCATRQTATKIEKETAKLAVLADGFALVRTDGVRIRT
jgi:hypothetical protein